MTSTDSASLITPVSTHKLRFKPEVRERGKISLVRANSDFRLLLAFYRLKTDSIGFKPEVRGRVSKLMVSLDLTRTLPFSDKRSVPACYHGGNISTLDSDFDVHRSGRNKLFET